MHRLKKVLIRLSLTAIILCITLYSLFFFFQDRLIFLPDKLNKDYKFNFTQQFEEINIDTNDGITLNGLLFTVDNPKGLIFYLHGNAGALNSWGNVSPFYTDDLGYDIFILDYRGFGKSGGQIDSQSQLFEDVQTAYNTMKQRYKEDSIVIIGYSIGTCPATYLASKNNPNRLILQAPYYSLTSVIQDICPIVPEFLIRYKLETYKYIENCKIPIVIFHGDQDDIIKYNNSLRLEKLLKSSDKLITLEEEGHNNITENAQYKKILSDILF